MTNFLIALVVTYMIRRSEPDSIKLKSNNYSRIEMLSMISNIQKQFAKTHILMYGIKSRANLRSDYFSPVLILLSNPQKTSRFMKFGFAISSDEVIDTAPLS